jgi:hypothetical protein
MISMRLTTLIAAIASPRLPLFMHVGGALGKHRITHNWKDELYKSVAKWRK